VRRFSCFYRLQALRVIGVPNSTSESGHTAIRSCEAQTAALAVLSGTRATRVSWGRGSCRCGGPRTRRNAGHSSAACIRVFIGRGVGDGDVSEGDTLSERKVAMLEAAKAANSESDMAKNGEIYSILTIPRARKVHQSLLTTPPTAIVSLLHCVYYVTIKQYQQTPCPYFADVLVLNGPGTCLTLCLAVYLNKFLGLSAPKMLYVESFARVKTLSVSGKLLHSLVDRFIVQWPQLLKHSGRGEFHGWLI